MKNIAFKLAGKTLSIVSSNIPGKGTGDIFIKSDPPETEVYLNNQLRGKTPLVLRDLDIGEKVLEFNKQGYGKLEKRVNVTYNNSTLPMLMLSLFSWPR